MKRLEKLFFLPLLLCTLVAVVAVPAQTRRGLAPADTLRIFEVTDAQISPNGALVAYIVSTNDGNARRSSLWLVSTQGRSAAAGQEVFPLMPPPVEINTGGVSPSRPRWSPDGRRLAFTGAREQAETRTRQSGIWMLTVSEADRQTPTVTTPPRLVAAVRETNFHIAYAGETFAWSPDSRRIAYISAVEETSDGAPSLAEAGRATENRSADPRVVERIQYKSRTGFSDALRTHVFVVDTDDASARTRQLTSGQFYDHALTWSPRGDEVAFLSNHESDPDANNNSDIFAVDMEGRVRRLTATPGCELEPQWSPNGRWIAHTATTRAVTTIDSIAEDAHVWLVDASDGSRREISGALDRRARSPRWSPDSQTVFFLAGDRGRTLIFGAGTGGAITRPLFDRFARTPADTDEASGRDGDHNAATLARLPLRPFQTSSFSVSTRASLPVFAFTLSDTLHPSEVWLGDATGRRARRVTAHNDSLLRGFALVEPEDISFRSFDGTSVQGWLMKPLDFAVSSSRLYPLILRIHGGPHGSYGYNFDAVAQSYAARGYAVLYLNPRGSTGYGQKFSDGTLREWGGGDYRDLMTGLDEVLRTHTWIDQTRMGVTGGSYGGFMTNWIVTQTPRFRAAVASASVSNLISFYGTSLYQDLIHAEFGGFSWDDYELLWRYSPLRYVRAVETPTLFIHGELDNDVHITQAEEMYMALRRRGVETALVRYPREGHSFREPAHRVDVIERTLAWFDRFLK